MERVGIYFSLGGFFVRKDGKRFSLYLIAALILVSITSFMMLRSEAEPYAAARPDVIYVSAGCAGEQNGTSWNDAYAADKLQDAVNVSANSGGTKEVWGMRGNYAREEILTLTKGAKLYGGFDGTETSVESRDIAGMMKDPMSADHAAVLDGQTKAFEVVAGGPRAASDDTRLDGFTITRGRNGMRNDANNHGNAVGDSRNPTVANCTFTGNGDTEHDGGGMYNRSSDPVVTNCIFSNNTARYGGGMYNGTASPTVTNCTFSGNAANDGGGMYNTWGLNAGTYYSQPVVTNCTFSGNDAAGYGGGMFAPRLPTATTTLW